jgi:hypothetical protein
LESDELWCIIFSFSVVLNTFLVTGRAKTLASVENVLFPTCEANALLEPAKLEFEDIPRRIGPAV